MTENNPEEQEMVSVMDIIRDSIQTTKTDFSALDPENAGFLVEIEMKIQPIIDRLQAELADAKSMIAAMKVISPLPEPQGDTVTTAGDTAKKEIQKRILDYGISLLEAKK